MQTIYQKMETTELDAAIEALKAEVAEVKAKGLALDMARGKPSPSQVDISRPMLDILNADADLHDGNVDCSNYGSLEGIPSARKLAGEYLRLPPSRRSYWAHRAFSSSINIAGMFWRCGSCGSEPWEAYEATHKTARRGRGCLTGSRLRSPAWHLPPTSVSRTFRRDDRQRPRYGRDRAPRCRRRFHQGHLVHAQSDTGISLARTPCVAWSRCPRPRPISASSGTTPTACTTCTTRPTSSPTSSILPARRAPRIAWWPCLDVQDHLPGRWHRLYRCEPRGHRRVLQAPEGRPYQHRWLNQLRHVRFLPTIEAVKEHMKKHAEFLRPRFEAVERKLTEGLGDTGCATWTHPRGGYFVSFDRAELRQGRRALCRPGRQAHAGWCHLALWQGSA